MIAAPLFWLLSFFHSWIGNWGVAIILLTMSVKAAFFPIVCRGLPFNGETSAGNAQVAATARTAWK